MRILLNDRNYETNDSHKFPNVLYDLPIIRYTQSTLYTSRVELQHC